MSKTITLKINEELYQILKKHAENENRSLTNFIETATLKYIDQIEFVDEFEMEEINQNSDLKERIKNGSGDRKELRGNFA